MDSARVRACLNIDSDKTSSVRAKGYAIQEGLSDTALFPSPLIPVAMLLGQLQKLDAADHLVRTRVKGAREKRDAELRVTVGMLKTELTYVQNLCDTAEPATARALVAAAGMDCVADRSRDEALLKIIPTLPSGSVILDAHVRALVGSPRKVFFSWQWTIDGGKTFTDAPPTARGKTVIHGFAPLSMVGFRVSAGDGTAPPEWTPIVTVRIL
jgi:hypothetical protein